MTTQTTLLDRALDALDYIARAAHDPLPATLAEASGYAGQRAADLREALADEPGPIDYGELNNAAAFLFDNAKSVGYREGQTDATDRLVRDHTVALLDLARVALERAQTETGDERTRTALVAGLVLGRTPMLVQHVGIALSAIGRRGVDLGDSRDPDVDRALDQVKGAIEKLGGYR